jgi:hypothetical protein
MIIPTNLVEIESRLLVFYSFGFEAEYSTFFTGNDEAYASMIYLVEIIAISVVNPITIKLLINGL